MSDETPTPDEPDVSVPTRRSGGRIAPDGTWLPATDEPPATAETLVVDRPDELEDDDVDDAPEPVEAVALVRVEDAEDDVVAGRPVRRWPVLAACIVVTLATAVLGALAYKAQHESSDKASELAAARQDAATAHDAEDAATARAERAEGDLADANASNTALEAQVADLTSQLQAAQEAAAAAAAHAAETDAVVTAARPAVTQLNRCIDAVDRLSAAAHNLSVDPLSDATVNAFNAATATVIQSCGAAAAAAANLQQAIDGVH